MDVDRAKKQGGSAQTGSSAKIRSANAQADRPRVHAEGISSHLAKSTDIDGLLQENQRLTADGLRPYFARAQSTAPRASTVPFWKGANRMVIPRTHGLPTPDLPSTKAGFTGY